MSFTVLKVSNTIEDQIEVIGEFPNREEATQLADECRRNDLSDGYEYLVEAPLSAID